MSILMTRRAVLMTALLTAYALPLSRAQADSKRSGIETGLRDIEARSGGRLGVAVLNGRTGELQGGSRIDERFPMCSTFKILAAGFVLARADRGEERLDHRIVFTERELRTPSPVTKLHVGTGMSVGDLCEAAVTVSDSTAANLLLARSGGPKALTTYLRSLGDPVTRLDRIELDLNIVRPGETHDTTSPFAMAHTLRRLILGDALSEPSRKQLTSWMIDAKDAATRRLRVGVPSGWPIGNKPGTWEGIATNDIAIIWPPNSDPIVVTAYLASAPTPINAQEAILADVGRLVSEARM